jgi:hypothetical protein
MLTVFIIFFRDNLNQHQPAKYADDACSLSLKTQLIAGSYSNSKLMNYNFSLYPIITK